MVLNSQSTVYGNPTSKAASFLTKRKSDKSYGFKFPFSNLEDGGFLNKSSDLEVIKSGLRQLLLTTRGERVMVPNFGTNLKNYLMEPLDQATLSQIRREILESFSKYARNVTVNKIQVFPGEGSTLEGGYHIFIMIFCTLKEEENISFEIKVDII